VAGIHGEAKLTGHLGGGGEPRMLATRGPARGLGIGAGVQFDHRRAGPGGGGDLLGFRVDEQ
jgi:hypothetical protein